MNAFTNPNPIFPGYHSRAWPTLIDGVLEERIECDGADRIWMLTYTANSTHGPAYTPRLQIGLRISSIIIWTNTGEVATALQTAEVTDLTFIIMSSTGDAVRVNGLDDMLACQTTAKLLRQRDNDSHDTYLFRVFFGLYFFRTYDIQFVNALAYLNSTVTYLLTYSDKPIGTICN